MVEMRCRCQRFTLHERKGFMAPNLHVIEAREKSFQVPTFPSPSRPRSPVSSIPPASMAVASVIRVSASLRGGSVRPARSASCRAPLRVSAVAFPQKAPAPAPAAAASGLIGRFAPAASAFAAAMLVPAQASRGSPFPDQ